MPCSRATICQPGLAAQGPLIAQPPELKQEPDGQSTRRSRKRASPDRGGNWLAFVLVASWAGRNCGWLRACLHEQISMAQRQRQSSIATYFCFTEYFCGFHSPRVYGAARLGFRNHSCLPQREKFFAPVHSTFRLILAHLQVWVFRYLTPVSPSSVATLRNIERRC